MTVTDEEQPSLAPEEASVPRLADVLTPRPHSRIRRRLHTWFTARRKVLVKVHRWASLVLAIWVILEALSGAVLTFEPEINQLVQRDVFTASGEPDPELGWDEVGEIGTGAHERGRLAVVVPPGEQISREVWWVGVYDDDGDYHAVLVDPADGEVLDADQVPPRWLTLIEAFHINLNMTSVFGLTGIEAVGLLGLAWLLIVVTGFYLWYWPGVKRWANAWRVRRARGRFTFHLDLHKAVGITILVPLLLVVVTGVYFGWPEQSRSVWDVLTLGSYDEADAQVPLSTPSPGSDPVGIDAAVEAVRELDPSIHVEQVTTPQGNPVGVYDVHGQVDESPFDDVGGERTVDFAVDQYSGAVIEVDDPGTEPAVDQALNTWVAPVHFGTWGGLLSKLAWVALGLAVALMAVTGTVMYVVRFRKRRSKSPSPEGAPT